VNRRLLFLRLGAVGAALGVSSLFPKAAQSQAPLRYLICGINDRAINPTTTVTYNNPTDFLVQANGRIDSVGLYRNGGNDTLTVTSRPTVEALSADIRGLNLASNLSKPREPIKLILTRTDRKSKISRQVTEQEFLVYFQGELVERSQADTGYAITLSSGGSSETIAVAVDSGLSISSTELRTGTSVKTLSFSKSLDRSASQFELLLKQPINVAVKRASTNATIATYRFFPNVPLNIWSDMALQVQETVLGSRAQIDGRSASAKFQNGVGCSTLDCFLTTATVDTLGLPDDCWELSSLRRFRDGPMRLNNQWRALVEDYDNIAPAIVEAVNARRDAKTIWARTYLSGVLPAAIYARIGLNTLAVWVYRRMVSRLRSLEVLRTS
jgi:hypothetical protein